MTATRLAPGVTTTTPVTIRRACPADAEQLQQLYANTMAYSSTMQLPYTMLEDWADRMKRQDGNHIVLVALVDDVIVGNAGLHIETRMRRRHAASFGIAVADQSVGQGIGSALLAELLVLADNWLNILRLELTVFTDNAAAIALYRKFGFVIEGTHRGYALRDGKFIDVHAMARLHPSPPGWSMPLSSE
jgi:putative acetyltransferase